MNPFSFPVLAGAALLSSPALWRSLNGYSSIEMALSRYLVAALVCWAGLNVVAMLVGPPPQPAADRAATEADPADAETESSTSPQASGTRSP